MLPLEHPDRIQASFDDHRLVANAGLLLPVTLAQHLGLRELVDNHVDLGATPGRANTGDKMLTLVASALAGGDCIDDADALRTGRTARVLGCVVKAPSTLGTFLRSFSWGHVRQLDRVGRELLARAWSAGAGPGDAPLTIDLDSTSARPTGWPRKGRDTMATPASGAITWVCGSHSGSCWAKCPLSTIVVVRPSHGPPPVGLWQPLRRRQPLLRRNRRYAVTLWGWQQSWDTARFVSGRRIWPGPGPRAGAPPPPALPKPPENSPQSRQWFRPNSDGRRGR